jgi:thiosulfate sulfurtransferase
MAFKPISINQAEELIRSGKATLLDIRDPASYAAGHIADAIHVSNDNVADIVTAADKQAPLIIYCYHGNSSQGAADYFSGLGFEQCYSVDGGYEAWKFLR